MGMILWFWKKKFPEKWQNLNQKLAYPYEFFNSIDDYKKPVDNLNKEIFFSKLKNRCPDDDEIERTREIIKVFDIKNGKELTQLYLKGDAILFPIILKNLWKYLPKNMVLILYIVSLYRGILINALWNILI